MKVRIKLFICAFFVLSAVCTSQAATIIVDPNGSGHYTTIQAAINNSNNGDEIIVRQGTYYETIDLIGRAITLRSINPNDPNVIVNTIIDANEGGTTITCNSSEELNTIIEGFIITGGIASDGGGIYCSSTSPTINNCTFADNTADSNGAGMYCYDGNPTLTNCTFNGNDASGDGGGMYCLQSSPTLTNCTFIDNEAVYELSDGGGICCSHSSPTLNNCTFINNWGTRGAGVACINSSTTLKNCTFISNIAEREDGPGTDTGGGVGCYDSSSPTLINCTFTDNEAPNGGGGMYCDGTSTPKLAGTVVCRNNPNQIVGSFTDNGGNIIGEFCPPVPPLGDLNGDRVVDFADFAIFADNWLKGAD